jgi:uncharacterized protein YyaL (SSP411 family)
MQHKDNPVHWQPWDDAALQAAMDHDRPILLSIGYAACHWCHVMAHESFEDDEVAAMMNRHFVSIKVDREERPDIDQIYMAALGAMGEQGGWPLTMALTPDGKPFWGGTYFPKTARYGRPGFVEVLQSIARAYQERRADIDNNAQRLTEHLQEQLAGVADPAPLSLEMISRFASQVTALYDPVAGGLRGAPKFPNAPFLETLWRSWTRDGDTTARDRFLETLTAICLGGIYDHVGGGLARYAVDDKWLVPHFEKMLYDNAHFIRHCVWAHAATGLDLFRIRIRETIEWLSREMTTDGGGLASSLDADSEGEEGKYYVWTRDEVHHVLGHPTADHFVKTYDISHGGNWEGRNIPNLSALRSNPSKAAATIRDFSAQRLALRKARSRRVPPGRDKKVLTDWNGFAIRAFAEAALHFGNESWRDAAKTIYANVLGKAENEDRLAHVHDGVKASAFGFATDYAAMINASLSLYSLTGEPAYLEDARRLADLLRTNHFDNESNRGYWLSERGRGDTTINPWSDADEANPSATAQIIEALSRLAMAGDDMALPNQLEGIAAHAAGRILSSRYGQAGFMNAADTLVATKKLVVVGNNRATDPLWSTARDVHDPRRFDLYYESGKQPPRYSAHGAYHCEGMTCSMPVNDPETIKSMLSPGESG